MRARLFDEYNRIRLKKLTINTNTVALFLFVGKTILLDFMRIVVTLQTFVLFVYDLLRQRIQLGHLSCGLRVWNWSAVCDDAMLTPSIGPGGERRKCTTTFFVKKPAVG